MKEETNNRLARILGVSQSFSLSATESQLSSESNVFMHLSDVTALGGC